MNPNAAARPRRSRSAIFAAIVAALGITLVVAVWRWLAPEPQFTVAQRNLARIDARAIQATAKRYRFDHPDEPCPTIDVLRETRQLTKEAARGIDPWDSPFRIVCGADISVVSFGPDRTEGTADDIRE